MIILFIRNLLLICRWNLGIFLPLLSRHCWSICIVACLFLSTATLRFCSDLSRNLSIYSLSSDEETTSTSNRTLFEWTNQLLNSSKYRKIWNLHFPMLLNPRISLIPSKIQKIVISIFHPFLSLPTLSIQTQSYFSKEDD